MRLNQNKEYVEKIDGTVGPVSASFSLQLMLDNIDAGKYLFTSLIYGQIPLIDLNTQQFPSTCFMSSASHRYALGGGG